MPEDIEKEEDKNLDIPPEADEDSKKIAEDIKKEKEGGSEETPPDEGGGSKEETPKEPDEGQDKDKKPEKDKGKEAGKEEGKEKEGGEEEREEGEEEPGEGEEKPAERTARLMPLYKHKIAEKKWKKEKEELIEQHAEEIRKLKEETAGQPSEERKKQVKEYAEKYGMEEEAVEDLLKIAGGSTANLEKKIGELEEKLAKKEQADIESKQDAEFDKEFNKEVLPLMEKDGISPEKRKKLKDRLKVLAFTEEYVKTPLKVIYKGEDSISEIKTPGKKSAESSGTPPHGGEGKEKKDWMDMSDDEFEKESDALGQKSSNITIKRGEEVIQRPTEE